MPKKLTKLEKSTRILLNANISQWCIVNTYNYFNFMNKLYKIDQSVEEYKVLNRADEIHDFTNECRMDKILVVINNSGNIEFYNQDYDLIENRKVNCF